MRKIIALLFVFFVLQASNLLSQNDSTIKPVRAPQLCEIKMHDGSNYIGYIERQTNSTIFLKSSAGVNIHIPKNNVISITFLNRDVVKDSLGNIHSITFASVAQNYYVLSSNAFLFKEKKFYGSSNYGLFYNLNYAVTRNFSVGISSFPILVPLVLNVKANFEISHKLYLGFDAEAGNMSWINSKTNGYGGEIKLTYGDERKNFTFFGGYGDYDRWILPKRRGRGRRGGNAPAANYYENYYFPFAGLAMSLPFTPIKHSSFVAEGFIFPNINVYNASAALRFGGRPKTSFVCGIQVSGSTSSNMGTSPLPFWWIAYPYLGFSFRI